MAKACAVQSRLRILPKQGRVMVRKGELLDRKTQKPLQLRNTALLSLDGGGLKGILTGSCTAHVKPVCYANTLHILSALHMTVQCVPFWLHASTSNSCSHNAKTRQSSVSCNSRFSLGSRSEKLMSMRCMLLPGVILEDAERVIKDVIQQDDLLPQRHKHLRPDEWGIDLADYFECVSGENATHLYLASAGLWHLQESHSKSSNVQLSFSCSLAVAFCPQLS